MKILIAGGAGFLGSNLTRSLLSQGHEVVVVDSLSTGSRDNISDLLSHSRFYFYEMGVETDEFVNEFIVNDGRHFDYVYDLACPTGVPNIQYLGEEMVDACSVGTKNLLRLALKHKAKFLLTSSSEVYGDPEVFPQTEDYTGNVDPQGWRANYEEGKRFAETLVSLFVKKHNLNAKTVRLFNVYGPFMNLRDQRVVPRFVTQALAGDPLTVHENNALRTMCFVSDIVRGLQLVVDKGMQGGIYNLGSDQELNMKELAEKIISLTKSSSKINFVPGMILDHKRRMPDLSKIHTLGWKQTVSLEKGLKLTIKDFKKRMPVVPVHGTVQIKMA
jgi:nucleoside-diphosphate-sugar epimerase